VIRERGIRSIAVPPLGCGHGGLDWKDVRPRIETALADLDEVDVRLYEPAGGAARSTHKALDEGVWTQISQGLAHED